MESVKTYPSSTLKGSGKNKFLSPAIYQNDDIYGFTGAGRVFTEFPELSNYFTHEEIKVKVPWSDEILLVKSTEEAFHMMKALKFGEPNLAKLINGKNPSYCKSKCSARSNLIPNFDKDIWDNISEEVMFNCVYAKFTQISSLMNILLETGDRDIYECSPWDKIWGNGIHCLDPRFKELRFKGENKLGKVLMRVRADIESQIS